MENNTFEEIISKLPSSLSLWKSLGKSNKKCYTCDIIDLDKNIHKNIWELPCRMILRR